MARTLHRAELVARSTQDILDRIAAQPLRVKDLAGGSMSAHIRVPVRAMVDELLAAGLVRSVYLFNSPHLVPRDWVPSRRFMADYVMEHCRPQIGGCLIWPGCMDAGRPMFSMDKARHEGRKVVWEAESGKRVASWQTVRVLCGNERCLNPIHMVREAKAVALAGRKRSVEIQMKVAESLRKRSLLTMEIAREIRAREQSNRAVAKDCGIPLGTVAAIRSGRTWREYADAA